MILRRPSQRPASRTRGLRALLVSSAAVCGGCGARAHPSPPTLEAGGTSDGNGIAYYGGRVMTAPTGVNLYYIWYGDWSGNTGPEILTDLATHIGGSPYFNVMTTYRDARGVRVKNAVNFLGAVRDSYSQGTAPTTAQIRLIVSGAISNGFPRDTNAVYFVLTSQDVAPASFCSACGNWGHFTLVGADIKYAWVGNAARCPSRCAPAQPSTGPNGNPGVDAMAATLVHELINAITNSDRNGWHDASGNAPASICGTPERAFPNAYVTQNGALATARIGSRSFYLTSNWVNARGGYCALSYAPDAAFDGRKGGWQLDPRASRQGRQ